MLLEFKDIRQKGFSEKIKLNDALEVAKNSFNEFKSENILIHDKLINNRILREDLYARRDIPPYDRSAVDGFAVKAEETFGISEDSPLKFIIKTETVIGTIPSEKVTPGTVIQVSTGAMIPEGANAVVMIEDSTLISEKEVLIFSKKR